MIKRRLCILAGLVTIMSQTVIGCGNTPDNNNGEAFNFMRGYQTVEPSQAINKENVDDPTPYIQYGYDRHTKEAASEERMPGYAVYDRPLLAESISEMVAIIPDVEDAGVLVTSQHVLIAYKSNSDNRTKVADQVKKTAMSVVPSYYDVYVADEPQLMNDIERFKGHYSENQAESDALEQTIEQMKSFPQGEDPTDN
jgi:hypothetical protein